MELEGLARGQADAAIQAVWSANLSITCHWAGVMMPPGRRARSMTLCSGSSFGGALGADVAVILLIHAVEADQLEVIAVEAAGERILQILRLWCRAGSCSRA